MPPIDETATVMSKGQIAPPKSIRQALEVDASTGFLNLLEQDIQAGRNIRDLPEPLLRKMLATLEQPFDPEVEIEDDIEL